MTVCQWSLWRTASPWGTLGRAIDTNRKPLSKNNVVLIKRPTWSGSAAADRLSRCPFCCYCTARKAHGMA